MDISAIYSLFQETSGVSIDTRKIEKDELFVALKGDNFNGNQYAQQAIDSGAKYAIIDEAEFNTGDEFILVDNALESLQALANYHRKQFEIPVIGITGSNGKTTTKELIHAALSVQFKVHYTKGNYNNHIGVPLTLLDMPLDTEIAIIEMGANHMKEIGFLSEIAAPTHGVITNCGKAHIEGFGSEENIKKGKGELFDFLRANNGFVFANENLDYLVSMSEGVDRLVYQEVICHATNPFLELEVDNEKFEVQLIGRYNVPNVSAAYRIARHFEIPCLKIIDGLKAYHPAGLNRSEFRKYKSANVIMDAYNANPSSMEAAIESFEKEEYSSKMVVLGDMFELGDTSEEEHQKVVEKLLEANFDEKVVVGEFFNAAANGKAVQSFTNTEDLKQWFAEQNIDGKTILIKGSRGMKLESILA